MESTALKSFNTRMKDKWKRKHTERNKCEMKTIMDQATPDCRHPSWKNAPDDDSNREDR